MLNVQSTGQDADISEQINVLRDLSCSIFETENQTITVSLYALHSTDLTEASNIITMKKYDGTERSCESDDTKGTVQPVSL